MAKKININTADRDQLIALKGIGPKLADLIIQTRKKDRINNYDELEAIKGISKSKIAALKSQITLGRRSAKKSTKVSKSKFVVKPESKAKKAPPKRKPKKPKAEQAPPELEIPPQTAQIPKKKSKTKRKSTKSKRKRSANFLDKVRDIADDLIAMASEKFEELMEVEPWQDNPPRRRKKKKSRKSTKAAKKKTTSVKSSTTGNKRLETYQIINAAKRLEVDRAALKAVIDVESNGSGFLVNNKPKILFEGHIFWKQLTLKGLKPEEFANLYPSILYPSWTKKHYLGGASEYSRLEKARMIDDEAALLSCSWGMFQIMGFNHQAAGFKDVYKMVEAHFTNEEAHLEAFLTFIRRQQLLEYLREKNWAKFAEGYNGKGYKKNRYDEKMAAAYKRFKLEGW